ncbi:hypothetical protein [Corynebacterium mustelae]|nr:hypothetical protein [Corynebacterium mustelae]
MGLRLDAGLEVSDLDFAYFQYYGSHTPVAALVDVFRRRQATR